MKKILASIAITIIAFCVTVIPGTAQTLSYGDWNDNVSVCLDSSRCYFTLIETETGYFWWQAPDLYVNISAEKAEALKIGGQAYKTSTDSIVGLASSIPGINVHSGSDFSVPEWVPESGWWDRVIIDGQIVSVGPKHPFTGLDIYKGNVSVVASENVAAVVTPKFTG